MKRVLEIFTFQGGYKGGVATMVMSYIEGNSIFSEHGYRLSNLNISPIINTGITIIDNFIYIFTQRLEVCKHLKKNNYDVIHIHTSREYLFFKDILLAKMIKKIHHTSVILTIHVGDVETVYNRISWFKKKSINIINNYIDKVIFLSKTMKNEFIEMGLLLSKSVVLYNFHNFIPSNSFCKHECNELKLQLLYVGAIHREKGIIELLSALNKLPNLDYHLNVCGQLTDTRIKKEISCYKNNLGRRVSFLGYVSGETKTQIFESSDILILPSYHEGLPIVILEALGAGCAIIATKVGAIPEILSEDNCFWVDIASDDSIIETLSNISFTKIKSMKEKNKDLGEIYSFPNHVELLCEIYNQVT